MSDEDIYNFFQKGLETDGIYKKDGNRQYTSLVNRIKVHEVLNNIKNGNSYIIHSDLGNGKTIFINQLIDLCQDMDVFYLTPTRNDSILKEIKKICSNEKEKIIILEPAQLYLDIFKKFTSFDLKYTRFILVYRSSMFDNDFNPIYEIIDQMNNVHFADPLQLNELEHAEINELDRILLKYGFYGSRAGKSLKDRLFFLEKNCKCKFQNILLEIFKSTHIIEKFIEDIKSLKTNKALYQILILSFINNILELGFKLKDYITLLKIDNIETIIKRNDACREFIDLSSNTIRVKSSIIAKGLIKEIEVFSKDEIFEVLITTMKQLDKLYKGSLKYNNAMVNLVSCSYLSYIFDYELDSERMIKYYEEVKELNFCTRNLFFWEQYAIACINLNQFDRAKKYFETAYAFAKNKGKEFSTYQIDNHYARYLLQKQLYYRNHENSLNIFLQAHKLLWKNNELENKNNRKYYKFRVARLYKDYYSTFAYQYENEDKKLFLNRCEEMYKSLLDFKKNRNDSDPRKDVQDCEEGLKFILTKENRL